MPVSKEGSERKGNKAHHEDGQQEALHPLSIAPTTLQWEVDLGVDDYRWKCGNKKRQGQMTLPFVVKI